MSWSYSEPMKLLDLKMQVKMCYTNLAIHVKVQPLGISGYYYFIIVIIVILVELVKWTGLVICCTAAVFLCELLAGIKENRGVL